MPGGSSLHFDGWIWVLLALKSVSHLWHNQGHHILIVIKLVEGFDLLASDDHVVKDQVVDQPVLHPPQYLRHVLDIIEDAPGSDCDVLQIKLVKGK